MTVGSILARGRARRQVLMRDTITVARRAGSVFNPTTGAYADTTTEIYSGIADVKPQDIGATDITTGERLVQLRRYDVALPFDETAAIRPDDLLTVDASDDASFVGRVLVVVDVGHGGRRTARHLIAEDRE